jgi:signal transduction histidine kinase
MIEPTLTVLPAVLQEARELSRRSRSEVIDPLLSTCLALDRLSVSLRTVSSEHAQELQTHIHSLRVAIRAMSAIDMEIFPNMLQDLGLEASITHEKERFHLRFPNCAVDCHIELTASEPNFVHSAAVCRLVSATLEAVRRQGSAIAISIRITDVDNVLVAMLQEDHGRKSLSEFPSDPPAAVANVAAFVKASGGIFDYRIRRGGPRVTASWPRAAMWSPWQENGNSTKD